MGTRRAALYWMAGAKHYEELIARQLADQIRVHVLTLTARERFSRDLIPH